MTKAFIDFKQIVERANDVVIVTDNSIDLPGPKIVYVNQTFERLTGYTSDEVLGKSPRILQGPDTSSKTREMIKNALLKNKAITTPVKNYTKYHEPYWAEISIFPLHDDKGTTRNFAAIQREITAQKAYEAELEQLSFLDPLTQAYNRRYSDNVISDWTAQTVDRRTNAILMLDIDNFKKINDHYGHQAGDKYLVETVRLISGYLRPSDNVCRTGGEEFLILLPQTTLSDAETIAKRLREAIEQLVVKYDSHKFIQTTVSIGVTNVNNGDKSTEDVVARADSALYSAKNSGKNKVVIMN